MYHQTALALLAMCLGQAPPVEPPTTTEQPVVLTIVPATGRPAAQEKLPTAPRLREDPAGHAAHAPWWNHNGHDDDSDRIRFYAFADLLLWSARGADVPFAQPRDGVTVLAVPRGPVAVADPDYRAGFRLGAGFALSCDTFLVGTFTWYQSNVDSTITAPPGTVLHALTTFPATFNVAADSLSASSRYDIDLIFADFDFKHTLWSCEHAVLRCILGARYGHLDQDFVANYSILGATSVTTNIRFDGGGPRVGLEGEHLIRGGFFTYGSGVANFLAGHFGASYLQQNVFAGTQVTTELGDDRIVPVLELEAGIGWRSSNDRFNIRAGYYAGGWFNTLTTPSWIQGVRNTNFTTNGDNFRDTLTFDGFVARLEVRY